MEKPISIELPLQAWNAILQALAQQIRPENLSVFLELRRQVEAQVAANIETVQA
jgi:hypothetical protein